MRVGVCVCMCVCVDRQSPALLYEDTDNGHEVISCSFGESFDLSNRLGYALQHKLGLARGDRVAILMSQSIETALVHMSVYKSGGIAVPLFILFGPEALEYRLQDSGAKIVFVEVSTSDIDVHMEESSKLMGLIALFSMSSLVPGARPLLPSRRCVSGLLILVFSCVVGVLCVVVDEVG